MRDSRGPSDVKNGSVNDRPLFMQNGNNRRFSMSDTVEISNFRSALPQFIAVSIKNILLFVYGMTLGFPTIVIPAIQGGDGREPSDIVLNRDEISWFSSINLICVPLGCIFSGILSQPIGKRRAMQLVNLPILASWLLFHFSTRTEHLYAALCLSGLGGGLMEAPVLTYVAEITEPKYRGILSALGSTCVITGVFIQFIMGSLMDWRTIAAVSSAFPVISIIALCFIPESPTWLIREERYREAIKALQWLRGWVPEHKIESEFNRLYDQLITQPTLEEAAENANEKPSKCKARMRLFRKRSFLVPFLLVAYTFFAGHFSGKTSLQTYAVQIFHTLKAPINKYHATILLGVAEMIATIICVFLIHFTGKRPLVLVSLIGVGCCFFGTATYSHYLQIVPGFAVNNVVVNASSIVPKDSIITQDNITRIFESEEKLLAAELVASRASHGFNTTTIYPLPDDAPGATTMPLSSHGVYETESMNRTRRQVLLSNDTTYRIFGNQSDFPDNLTFLDALGLDYMDSNETNSDITTPILDLSDSEEDDSFVPATTAASELQTTSTAANKPATTEGTEATENPKHSPTSKVFNDILLTVPKQEKNYLVWIPLILLLGSAFFAHCGIRMIPWILIGEVFPAPVRSTASGLVSAVGYIFGFLANKLFLQMLATLTLPGTFWFYSAVAFSGALVLYFTLPETEGRTLAEIEAHFSKKSTTNLLKKSSGSNNNNDNNNGTSNKVPLELSTLQNLEIPISPSAAAKIIHLQQSDFVPIRTERGGHTNQAYEEHNTTHL